MLARLVLEGQGEGEAGAGLRAAIARIRGEFPDLDVDGRADARPAEGAARGEARIEAAAWDAASFDFYAFDARMTALAARGPFGLCVSGPPGRIGRAALEILTRCQRLLGRRNAASRGAAFDEVLARHRALHDLGKPLVRADYDHALDAWQWALRLDPAAGLALQIAALFHDVERLVSEPDRRIEHLAADYQAFKDAHAAGGALLARRALAGAGVPPPELERALALVAEHERPRGDPDLDLLNDADALSFFSLNSGGFMDCYGVDHTRRKIAYTLRRLRPAARRRALEVRHRADVAPLVLEELSRLEAALPGGAR